MLKNYRGWLALFFAGIIPVIFLVTFALSFGDYFHQDPEVENAYRDRQALYSIVGLSLLGLSYVFSIVLSVASIKSQTRLSIISLCICAGYAIYVAIGLL